MPCPRCDAERGTERPDGCEDWANCPTSFDMRMAFDLPLIRRLPLSHYAAKLRDYDAMSDEERADYWADAIEAGDLDRDGNVLPYERYER